VLDAAVVSVLELSFLLHAVSASTAMANVANLPLDSLINIVPLPPSPHPGAKKKHRSDDRFGIFILSVCQAKTVHTALFFLLRSRAANGGEKRLVEHVGFTEPRECTLYIEGERPEPVGSGRRHVYGGEQNYGEELTVKEQSAETEVVSRSRRLHFSTSPRSNFVRSYVMALAPESGRSV